MRRGNIRAPVNGTRRANYAIPRYFFSPSFPLTHPPAIFKSVFTTRFATPTQFTSLVARILSWISRDFDARSREYFLTSPPRARTYLRSHASSSSRLWQRTQWLSPWWKRRTASFISLSLFLPTTRFLAEIYFCRMYLGNG